MAGTFGTLRKDSYFTPGAALDEATQLNNAIHALAQQQFNSGTAGDDQLASWNAFIASWNDFWRSCNAWDGWLFRAKDSTRDELLDFEGQYAAWKATIGATNLPDPAAVDARVPDNITTAADDTAKAVANAARNAVGVLWPVILIAGAAVGLYVFRGPLLRALGSVK